MSNNLLVLGNSVVCDIIISLPKADILKIQLELQKSLLELSVGKERECQPTPDFINRPNRQNTLFRPFTSPEAVGTKIVVTPASVEDSNRQLINPPLHGILALCNSSGLPTGLINAEEVTGYRTTQSALIPYMWRRHTKSILILGAGKQALWHSRLVVALRCSEIKSLTVINRSAARAQSLVKQVEEENQKYWRSSASFAALDLASSEYDQNLQTLLSVVDTIFCTVGSTASLFSLSAILSGKTRNRLPFVSAVGSWQADMVEMDPETLQHATRRADSYKPHGDSRGAIIVDDRDECLVKSGEVIQSGLKADQVIEVGEILKRQQGHSGAQLSERQAQLKSWLSEGFIVYKGIGVSLTDLAAGNAILALAKERNVGVPISNL